MGKSHLSYNFNGFQSALAIDAATPVAVYRPDYFADQGATLPTDFEDVVELAKTGCVAFAGIPLNLLMDFYMYCATTTSSFFEDEDNIVDRAVGIEALENMRRLACLCRPEIFGWDPIQVHEALAADSGLYYCPYAYGYTNYSRRGYCDRSASVPRTARSAGNPAQIQSVLLPGSPARIPAGFSPGAPSPRPGGLCSAPQRFREPPGIPAPRAFPGPCPTELPGRCRSATGFVLQGPSGRRLCRRTLPGG